MANLGMLSGWDDRNRWDALVRGEDWPACAEIEAGGTEEGFVVARLGLSHLRLQRNQFVPGYSVLVCTRHVPEIYHLSLEEQALFMGDMARAAQALECVYAPVKMNINLLGNLVPHLHAHLLPRYYGDPAPGRPIDPGVQVVTLTQDAYEERVREIRAAL